MTHGSPSRGIRRPLASDHFEGSTAHPSSAPSVVVVFELESAPYVYACWSSDADDGRLTAWFDSRPDYAALLHRAVELSGEAA